MIAGAFLAPHPPILLPEVGKGEEKKIEKTERAYREMARRAAALKPDTVVISSPHSVCYSDYFHISPGAGASGNMGRFGAPEARLSAAYDEEFVRELTRCAGEAGLAAGTMGERDSSLDHGTLIPLRYLQREFSGFRAVRLGLSGFSGLEHYRLGQCVARAAERLGRRTVFVASGDLSHKLREDGPYGFAPEGPRFDREITEAMAAGDFGKFLAFPEEFCEAAAECGLGSFQIMAGALDGLRVRPELLSYEGPFGVGYAVASFLPEGEGEERRFALRQEAEERRRLDSAQKNEDGFVRLARLSLETYVGTGKRIALPEDLDRELLDRRAGAFVTLKEHGRLRGCIGTIEPVTDCLGREILRNAVSAGTEDPRFSPVRKDELSLLEYSVDVLSPSEKIASPDQLDPRRYGVIVESRGRRGLLLPDLPGVDTPEEQIAISRQKAGIGAKEPVSLRRFEVVRHR